MAAEQAPTMQKSISLQAISAGALAAFVGCAGSFAVVLRGLTGVGASPAEAASGLMALSIAMGVCGILLSLRLRQPISIAWSTPGAALLATTGTIEGGFAAAVGAFLVCGGLVVLAGLWRPLGRAVAAIPASLANAMLGGVLLNLCLAPVRAIAALPAQGLAIILVWAVVARFRRLLAVPCAVAVTIGMIAMQPAVGGSLPWWPAPVLVTPILSWQAVVGIAVPLFIVTMASQNIPGIAVLNINGYRPSPGPLFSVTGLFSLLAAPFGGHGVNLAAITAALCAGEDADPDPARRWLAAVVAGTLYILFGVLAGAVTTFFSASPPLLIEAVAGLALLGAFASAVTAAMSEAREREAAAITFLVTASGLSFFGISGAFWGLVAGGLMLALSRWRAVSAPGAGPSRRC
jgi:benzoate membrane transport protein